MGYFKDFVNRWLGNDIKVAVEKPISARSIGSPGNLIYDGVLQFPNYTQSLQERQQRYDLFEQMLTDSKVTAIITNIQDKFSSGDWSFVPYSDANAEPTPRDIEVVDYISNSLFNMPGTPWDKFLYECIIARLTGCALFEIVLDTLPDSSEVGLVKLASRALSTIEKWDHDKDILKGVYQQTENMDDDQVYIPAEKLLRVTFGETGSNFEGVGAFIGMYNAWKSKQDLEARHLEYAKKLAGMITVTFPDVVSDADLNDLAKSIKEANRNNALFVNEKFKVDITFPPESFDFVSAKREYDLDILLTLNAEHLIIGTGDTGAYSAAKEHANTFDTTVSGIAGVIIKALNPLVKKLIDMKFGSVSGYPELVYSLPERTIHQQLLAIKDADALQNEALRKKAFELLGVEFIDDDVIEDED